MNRLLRTIGLLTLAGGLLAAAPASAAAQTNPFGSSCKIDNMRFLSATAELMPDRPGAERDTLSGTLGVPVVIICDDALLQAEKVTWETDTRVMHASGNVLFQQRDLRLSADHADVDGKTKLGTFYDAVGSARLSDKPTEKSMFGSLEPDVEFHGREISKTGPKTYHLTDGSFTTCMQPTPRWSMKVSEATIKLEDHAYLRNMVLRVKDVPLFYIPVMYYPLNKEGRQTGILLPSYSHTTVSGTGIHNAFFWAIDRSEDLTVYHDYLSKTGQGVGADYRYVQSQSSQGDARIYMLNETAQTDASGSVLQAAHRSYTIDGNANQALPANFRLIAQSHYFTDASTQQLFQNINDFSQRSRSFNAGLTGGFGRLRLSASATESDFFFGTTTAQRTGQLPSATLTLAEAPIGHSRIYYGLSGQSAYLVNQTDTSNPATNRSLWRLDTKPTIRAPLSTLPFLNVTASADWEATRWMKSQTLDIDPATGAPDVLDTPVDRQLLHTRVEMAGPTFARVFQTPHSGYADRFKHVIEPNFTVEHTTPFTDFDRVIKNDYGIDGLVGGVTTVTYGVTSDLLARRVRRAATGETAPAGVLDVLNVSIGQTYYTNALAANYDPQYQSASGSSTAQPSPFSPLTIRATARPSDTASGSFQMDIDARYRKIRTMNANASWNEKLVQLTGQWSKRNVIPGLLGFDTATHFLGATTTLRTANNTVGGTYTFNVDLVANKFVNQGILAYYNSQCCGIRFDWQTTSTPLLNVPSNRQFSVSFTLSGLGSFQSPLGAFGR